MKYWFGMLMARSWLFFLQSKPSAPFVAEAYERDHRGLDTAFDTPAMLQFHQMMFWLRHVLQQPSNSISIFTWKRKTRICTALWGNACLSRPGKSSRYHGKPNATRTLSGTCCLVISFVEPQWRENMTRIWQMVMPPPAFDQAKHLIQKAIGDDWAELMRRISPLHKLVQVIIASCWDNILGYKRWFNIYKSIHPII